MKKICANILTFSKATLNDVMGCLRGTASGKRGHISSTIDFFSTTSVTKKRKI